MLRPLAFLGLGFGHHPVSRKRKLIALAIAACADVIQGALFPLFWEGGLSPFDWASDAVTAILLWSVVGFKARLALAFLMELIPGWDLFPSWTALVLTLPVVDPPAPPGEPRRINPQPQIPAPEPPEDRAPTR